MAIALTAAAVIAVNLALAYLIVRAAGFQIVGPPAPAALVLLAFGLLIAAAAVVQWRRYLRHDI